LVAGAADRQELPRMKDRIIAAYLADFVKEFGLGELTESEAFETFGTYCAVSKHHPDSFDPDGVVVGGSGDLGLDGVGILVNDHLVSSREDVDHLKKALRRLDVQFVFVQAKTSAHFEAADIGTLFAGVRQFFGAELSADANEQVRELHDIKEHIFDRSIDMDKSPVCRMYYVGTGQWNGETALRTRIDQGLTDIRGSGLFSAVEFTAIDAEGLKSLYRSINHKIVREIDFDKHTILPTIAGVQEAYIGLIPCLEYLKLICDDDGSLNRRLFYDNVRDFQGNNPVNSEIESTIQDATRRDRFSLLNNGVTVVASDVNKVGARFKLKDFQVVNGCQTSHILHINRDRLTPSTFLPIKLIVTTDPEVTNQIIQGTNRQTEVRLEAFESLAPFQKKLEELYIALAKGLPTPLYYERRSKQYENLGIGRERVITLPAQIKCFVGMFLNEPQSTHRYYGELLSSYGKTRIFNEAHAPLPYFVSGLALATIERLFLDGRLPRAWKPRKFQILMVYRLQAETGELPALNSKAIEKYCDGLLAGLNGDSTSLLAQLKRAGELVESVRAGMRGWRVPPERTREFTSALMEKATRTGAQGATITKTSGTVKWFSDVRGYGFISEDDGAEVFVHFSGIAGSGYRSLLPGQRVEFAVADAPRGRMAVDVQVLD
jgi:cold shock CspA family protein